MKNYIELSVILAARDNSKLRICLVRLCRLFTGHRQNCLCTKLDTHKTNQKMKHVM